jgi:hypothetical protein
MTNRTKAGRSKAAPFGEATARLQAETLLIKRHDAEFKKLLVRKPHVVAVRDLVKRHGPEYGALVKDLRERLQVQRAIEAAGTAA